MEFERRLEKAIERGRRTSAARQQAERDRELTEQEFQRLHSQYRLELSEQIERCLQQLADRFPGFAFATIVDERGWGAAIRRDDLHLARGRRTSQFSRAEMLVRPLSDSRVLELNGKATVNNRELFNRQYYEPLAEVDITTFTQLIDNWSLEYAERYAGKN
jgi:hypothetical protein